MNSSRGHTANDVFISYARADRDLASTVAVALEAAEVEVWWDARLLPGDRFDEVIQSVLADTKVIIGLLSPEALASDWVLWELGQAHDAGLWVLPVLFGGAKVEDLPPPLDLIHALVLPSPYASEDLLALVGQVRRMIYAEAHRTALRAERPEWSRAEAQRRLASAAAETARRAAAIKRRKNPQPAPDAGGAQIARSGSFDGVPGGVAESVAASDTLVELLAREHISIAIASSQATKLFLVSAGPDGQLLVGRYDFERPMGLYPAGETLLLAGREHVHRLVNVLAPGQILNGAYRRCLVTRTSHLVGDLDVHDVAMSADGEVWLAIAGFNCIGRLSSRHSFACAWLPPFISAVVSEDRCHLNGLAMRDDRPAFATAAAACDSLDGWRDRMADGGLVLDVARDAVICEGLSMPHSPRWHNGELWVLNSGAGELGRVVDWSAGRGRFLPLTVLPGFGRGLALHGGYAYVGLSKPRYDDFAGLPLGERAGRDVPWCGVRIVETRTGVSVGWLRLEPELREVSDVCVLPGPVTYLDAPAARSRRFITIEPSS